MTIQYVLVPAFTKQYWLSFVTVKDSSTFFSDNLVISPTQHLCDCKLLRAAGNGIPFAAMIRQWRSHVALKSHNQQIIARTSDFLVMPWNCFQSERIQKHTRNSVGIDQWVSRKPRPRKLRPQTLKTQTLWVSRKLRPEKLRPSGCLENSDPKN